MRKNTVFALLLSLAVAVPSGPPVVPALSLVELSARRFAPDGRSVTQKVRVAHPAGWAGEKEDGGQSITLHGPAGKILIAAVGHPSELDAYLDRLRRSHPSVVPSPPQALMLPGIDPQKGERATRFVFTGGELGEMVTVERADMIVLFATVVSAASWAEIQPVMTACYSTVEVKRRAP